MQDEINEKTIALYIKTGKLTAQTLQKAMKTLLAQMKKQKDKTPQGKQTLKQLMKQNAGVSNIEITEGNIKAFESTAKKYGIDFALKKDTTESPPRYLVFFKGRDADVLTAAFKEFSAKKLTQEKKPSIRKLLSCLQNAVYVLLDNVIFPDFLFQLAIIGVKGFFLRLECFIFLLQRGGIGELCNARRFECLCRSFMVYLDNVSVNGNFLRYAAMFRVGTSFIFSRIKSRSASVTLNLICTVLLRPSMLSLLSIPRVWDTSQ